MIVRGTATTAKRSYPVHLALPHCAPGAQLRRRTKRSDKRSRRGRMLPPPQRRNASLRGGDWRGDTGAVREAVQLGRRSCGANRRGNEGLFKTGDREGRRAHVQHVSRTVPLTVKLRGRAPTSDRRRGRTLSSGARGAQPLVHHGPLQRLLCVPVKRKASVDPIPQLRAVCIGLQGMGLAAFAK